MLHTSGFTAILDANVLYPAPLRDYLLSLAAVELYKPKWTGSIQEEWIGNLLLKRSDLKRQDLERSRKAMDSAFPDANVTNYKKLISGISLPDVDDRHVVAAAIEGNAEIIVTFNLKDFPLDYLKSLDIEVQHPDDFVRSLIDIDKTSALEALNNQVKRLKTPPKSLEDVLQMLEKCGLINSVASLKD